MNRKSTWIVAALVGVIAIVLVGWSLTRADQLTESDTFMNPILPDGADPFLYEHDGSYVYTQTTGSNVTLWRTDAPSELATAESKVIWQPTKGERDIWAPEIHFVNDRWYVYYADVIKLSSTSKTKTNPRSRSRLVIRRFAAWPFKTTGLRRRSTWSCSMRLNLKKKR